MECFFFYLAERQILTFLSLHLSDPQELEKLASRKLRINAKETMKIAEKLYTQGWVFQLFNEQQF